VAGAEVVALVNREELVNLLLRELDDFGVVEDALVGDGLRDDYMNTISVNIRGIGHDRATRTSHVGAVSVERDENVGGGDAVLLRNLLDDGVLLER
jgi:hypothetical protein